MAIDPLGLHHSSEAIYSGLPSPPSYRKMNQQYPVRHPADSRAGMLPVGYTPTYIHNPMPQGGPHGHNVMGSHHIPPDPSQLPPLSLQRSMSTPDTRRLYRSGLDSLQTVSGSERRRNKLGYHRTSVACSHCRKRKIRCIPSASDVQGRCLNCIRLKKDCSFIPADQQQTPTSRNRSSASSMAERSGSTPSTSSGAGSQDLGDSTTHSTASMTVSPVAVRCSSQDGHPASVAGTSRDSYASRSGKRPSVSSDGIDKSKAGIGSFNFNAQRVPVSGADDSWPRAAQADAQQSPFSQSNMYSSPWTSSEGDSGAQNDSYWNSVAQPSRSVSFSNDSAPMPSQGDYMAYSHGSQYPRQSPFPHSYPNPPMGMNSSNMMMPSNAPTSGHLPSQQHLMWQQPQQTPYQNVPTSIGGWGYTPQMGASPTSVEEPTTTSDSSQTIFYTA